jgi:hypothetical protein
MSLIKAISMLCASCSATAVKRKYLSWILPIAAAIILSSGPASAQTAFSFSFSGTGTSSGGNFSLLGSGTITPYGATTITVNGTAGAGGSLGIAFLVTFGDGSTWTATATVTPTSSTSISGNAAITSGTGTFLGAHGSFAFVTTGPYTLSSFAFTTTGAGALSNSTGTRVVPGFWTNNSGTNSPVAGTPSSIRYQQLIGKQQFGSGTIIINQIAFRAYPGTGPLNLTIANLTVNLSTSPLYPNREYGAPLMSTTFANNIGSDNTLVFSGPKNVSSPGCAGPSPCPFDVVIPLSTPFVYNPAAGTLLVDIQATGFNATAGSFDDALFAYPPGGGVASVSGALGSATGIFAPSGHVMQVGYTGCSYGLTSPGQTFPAAGGTANVTVNTPVGCSWSISGVPNWITPSALSGSGTTALSFQVGANAGADQSTTFPIAGVLFNIQQQAASIAGLNLIGSMAHLAAEENWTTTFTLVNKSGSTATARLNLFGDAADPTGSGPLTLPVAFPQQPVVSNRIDAAFVDSDIAPNASWLVTTQVLPASTSLAGSAQLAATGPVDGFAIFHHIPTAQEAVVPLETRNASSYLLAYDNTGGIVLGIAVSNISTQAANVNVVLRDDTGAQIGSPLPITLTSNQHKSFVLSSQFPATANKRGTIEFDTPPGGQISVLGIRFTPPNNALTTIPALANVGTGGGSIAHLAAGGDGWQTTFVLVNTGTSATSATLSFFNDQTGFPLSLPLTFPQGGTGMTAPTYTAQLAAGASVIIVSSGTPQLLVTGSAQLSSTGNVSGFVIFRHGGQEAVVPLESRNANGYIIAFDNTSGTFTGIALNSVSALPANVPVIIRDDTGAQIGTDTLTLAANGHLAFTLVTDKYPQTANIRGTIEFDKPAGATIGALGIRIPPGALTTYTTLPALAK